MSQLTLEELTLLLSHLVRCEQVTQKAVSLLDGTDFNGDNERPFQLIWTIVKEFYQRTHRAMPYEYILAEINRRLEGSSTMSPPDMALLEQLLGFIYPAGTGGERVTGSEQFFPDVALNWLQRLVDDRKLRPMMTAGDGEGGSINYPELVQTMNRAYAQTRVSATTGVSVFDMDDPSNQAVSAPYFHTGIDWFDLVTGGGIRAGDSMGLLAPTSGGKTLAAVQVCTSLARCKQYSAYFTYEQPATPDIRDRAISAAGNWEHRRISGIPREQWDHDTACMVNSLTDFRQYMRVFDMQVNDPAKGITGAGGVDEIECVLQEEAAAGRRPRFVVIDWISTMARRYMAFHNIEDTQIRSVILGIMSRLKGLAGTYHTTILSLQQLSGDAGAKGTGAKVSHYDAMDCKGFALMMDLCLVIGAKDFDTKLCEITSSKSRNADNAKTFILMDGARNRFNSTDQQYKCVVGSDGVRSLVGEHEFATM
jgi:hypothetical protein